MIVFRHLLVTAMCLAPIAAASTQQWGTRRVSITDIEARLFCENTGLFSNDMIGDEPAWSLWNTMIGEGWAAGCRSTSTFVTVLVQGPNSEYAGDVEVVFRAEYTTLGQAGTDTVVTERGGLGILNSDGLQRKGFWLHRTGCSDVLLTATLSGSAKPSTRRETILFRCGE